jgi:biotin carboxylase
MHIALVDSTSGALTAIESAKQAGHRVSYLQATIPSFYPLSPANLRLIGCADWVEQGVETTDAASVTGALARIHAAHPIDFAVSHMELSVEPVALACQALGLPGSRPEGVLIARRKDRMRAALAQAGVATAAFSLAADSGEALAAAEVIGYPVVIKPPSGFDSRLTFVARDPAGVLAACRQTEEGLAGLPSPCLGQLTRGLLVEEHLSGPLVSVEIGICGERSYPFCISGRTRAREDEVIETGVHIPAELSAGQARACIGYAESVCRAIGLDQGVFHLEMIITGRGPVLVEANPRIMGGILPTVYQHASGQDIYRNFLQVISGVPVEGVPPVFTGCVAGRRFFVREPGTMPQRWDIDDWLGADRDTIIAFDAPEVMGVQPGQSLRRGNVIARVILRGQDYAATACTARDMIRRAEKALGLELMTGEYDDLA